MKMKKPLTVEKKEYTKYSVTMPNWVHNYLKKHANRTGRYTANVYRSLLSDWVLDRMKAEDDLKIRIKEERIKNKDIKK